MKNIKENFATLIISFVLGGLLVYFSNLGWITRKENLTNSLIANFDKTYDIQEKIATNCANAILEVSSCLEKGSNCNMDIFSGKIKSIDKEDKALKKRLIEINKETQAIIK